MGITSQELAKLQKRLKLRRILPSCINFEDLEDERTSGDHEAMTRLELVDSNLADAHRGVMQRTANRYLGKVPKNCVNGIGVEMRKCILRRKFFKVNTNVTDNQTSL